MKTKSHLLVSGLTILMSVLFSTNTLAEWRIDIESKTVNAGETGVTIDFTGYWDLAIWGLSVPTVVREIDPGAFWTDSLPVDTTGGAIVGVQWNWEIPGWADLFQAMNPGLAIPSPSEWCTPGVGQARDTLYDGISPDHFAVSVHGLSGTEPAHPDGRVFLTLTFDVADVAGSFEFDTACFNFSQSTIFIIGSDFMDHGPTGPLGDFDGFNKGIITIISGACDCTDHGDCNDDGVISPVDVVYFINYALRMTGPPPPSDPACPVINRGDWDCSGQINLVDVIKMIDYVYRQPAPGPCDPCKE